VTAQSGKSAQKVAQISSTSVKPDIIEDRLIPTLGGASADIIGALEDEPMWQHSTVLVSQAALNSGYQ